MIHIESLWRTFLSKSKMQRDTFPRTLQLRPNRHFILYDGVLRIENDFSKV